MDNLDLEEIDLEKILEKLNQKERDIIIPLIERDSLTRVYNRRKFNLDMEIESLRVKRANEEARRKGRKKSNKDIGLIMIDIDYFKQYNDEYGHTEGDKKLIKVADCLKENLRVYENVYRYGGEEFAVLIPDRSIKIVFNIGERLRKNVKNSCNITISAGVANYQNGCNNLLDLIDFADKALYNAKKEGKNNVKVYQGVK